MVTGTRTTANVASAQRYIDIAPEIMKLDPNATPFVVITSRMNKKQAGDAEFSWMESEREVVFDAINKSGGYEATDEELIVDTEGTFAPGQLVQVQRTSEIMFVKELKGTNKVKFERGAAGTTKAAIENDDVLLVIAFVAEEGASSFEARTNNPTKITNNTQIFRTSIEATGTWGSSLNQTTPHDWVFQHQEKNREHLLQIERVALHGHKSVTTGANGKPLRTTGGLLSFYTANNQDMGGTMTESELATWVRSLTTHGSDEKTVFASALALDVINAYAVGRLQVVQSDANDESAGTTYGVKVTKYMTANGTLNLVKHKLLEGAVFGGYMIAVDYRSAPPAYRPLGGGPMGSRDTKLLTNRQANDADGQKDEILTEVGFGWPQPKTGGVATGITG